MSTNDQQLGMDRSITRRDFLNGVRVAIGGAIAASAFPGLGSAAESLETSAQDRPGYYPPALTGMRGSTDGSYEAAHALGDGDFWKKAGQSTRIHEVYDLIVVGGSLSGLSAAYFYRQQNPSARILILENHDDFGGHAKRNEFRPGGRLLLANGGTWAIESPFPYSKEAAGLMADLQIDPAALPRNVMSKTLTRICKPRTFLTRKHLAPTNSSPADRAAATGMAPAILLTSSKALLCPKMPSAIFYA